VEHKQVNLLVLGLGTTVGFIEWLDFRAVLPDECIIKFAFAIYDLPAAHGTSLYVAAEDVKLAFPNAAIMTRLAISSPILFLIAISNPVGILATDSKARLVRVVHHQRINLTPGISGEPLTQLGIKATLCGESAACRCWARPER
jgi:hypothetical protein